MVHGKISVNSGTYKGKTVEIYSEKNTVWMSIPSGFSSTKVNLTKELAQVESDSESRTSKRKVLALSAVAGLAGATSSRATSYALLGAASSMGTEKHTHHIAIRLKNGETIGGETQPKVIDLLERISPDISDRKILEIKKSRERLQQYIEDAPRTIHETKDQIEIITEKMKTLEIKITEGTTFEDRQRAKEAHASLKHELSQQEQLYVMLDNRLKGIQVHGSAEEYQKTTDRLDGEISDLQSKIAKGEDRGFKKKHLGLMVLLFFANDGMGSDDTFGLGVILLTIALVIGVREVSPRLFLNRNREKLATLLRERNGAAA